VRLDSRAVLLLVGATWVASARGVSAQVYTRKNGNGVVEATNVPDASDYRLTYPGKGTLIHSRGFHRAYRGEFDAHIAAASNLHNVSADLIRAVIAVESEFDQFAVSSKGAQGLMQLMPFTARRFGVESPFDARQNIFGGAHYLRLLLDMFQGDVDLALAGYNAGENAVVRYHGIPPYRETRAYVDKVQGFYGGGVQLPVTGGETRAAYYAPAPLATAPTAKHVKLVPARPRVYYRWNDAGGVLHVAHTPPAEGVVYAMIRALD
jgi:soluble lytic murein transglycosylase-like protein